MKRAEHTDRAAPRRRTVAEANTPPRSGSAHDVIALQGAVGNRATMRVLSRDDKAKVKPPPPPKQALQGKASRTDIAPLT
jgi:hypothetical protein